MMKEQIVLTLAANGVLVDLGHESQIFGDSEEGLKNAINTIAGFIQGYYSNTMGQKEFRISTRTTEGLEDDTEGI